MDMVISFYAQRIMQRTQRKQVEIDVFSYFIEKQLTIQLLHWITQIFTTHTCSVHTAY